MDDDGEGDQRSALERAQRVEDVADRVVDEGGAARVATLVGGQRHRTRSVRRAARRASAPAQALVDELRVSRSIWKASSSSSSRSTRRGANNARARSCQIAQIHWRHASFMTRPIAADIRSHSRASTASCRRPDGGELVVLRPPAELGDRPLRFNPALVFEPMEGGIERTLVDLQHVLGDLLDPFGDRPAVQRLGLQRPQDQQVERAGEQVGYGAARHWCR